MKKLSVIALLAGFSMIGLGFAGMILPEFGEKYEKLKIPGAVSMGLGTVLCQSSHKIASWYYKRKGRDSGYSTNEINN